MKRVRIKTPPGAFTDADGGLVSPNTGDEVSVTGEMAKALIDGGFAEEVKPKRKAKAQTGPEETRG